MKLSRVAVYSNLLESRRVPNYEAIKNALGQYEADVVNIMYLLSVVNEKKKAAALIDRLVKEHPNDPRLLMLKSGKLMEEGDIEGAKTTLEKVLEIEPEHHRAKAALLRIKQIKARRSNENK